jgi:hypothetical protein
MTSCQEPKPPAGANPATMPLRASGAQQIWLRPRRYGCTTVRRTNAISSGGGSLPQGRPPSACWRGWHTKGAMLPSGGYTRWNPYSGPSGFRPAGEIAPRDVIAVRSGAERKDKRLPARVVDCSCNIEVGAELKLTRVGIVRPRASRLLYIVDDRPIGLDRKPAGADQHPGLCRAAAELAGRSSGARRTAAGRKHDGYC